MSIPDTITRRHVNFWAASTLLGLRWLSAAGDWESLVVSGDGGGSSEVQRLWESMESWKVGRSVELWFNLQFSLLSSTGLCVFRFFGFFFKKIVFFRRGGTIVIWLPYLLEKLNLRWSCPCWSGLALFSFSFCLKLGLRGSVFAVGAFAPLSERGNFRRLSVRFKLS